MSTFHIKAGDTLPVIEAQLTDADGPVDLASATVTFRMRSAFSEAPKVEEEAAILDAASGRVAFQWTPDDTGTPGTYRVEWEIDDDGEIVTFPNTLYNRVRVHPTLVQAFPAGSFATLDDFIERKGEVVNDDGLVVEARLADASDLIKREVFGSEEPWVAGEAPPPRVVTSICVDVAYRAWSNPDALSQTSMADTSLSYTREGIADALFLTKEEKRTLSSAAGTSPISVVTLVSPYSGDGVHDDEWDL